MPHFSYYTNPPPAFLPGSFQAPVPGWGANPAIVGPTRLGVGAARATVRAEAFPMVRGAYLPGAMEEGIPTWYWMAGGVMVAGLAAVAYQLGYLKRFGLG